MPVSAIHSDTYPAYLALLESGELQQRAEQALRELEHCCACPWECGINRLADEKKVCRIGRYARVASYFAHFGEEDCLRGWRGSGTIFFAWCNLRCVFCQNFDISQADAGVEVNAQQLADIMLQLQEQGCHNINLVTPEHVVPQIVEALALAIPQGLRLPIVYNTSAFDSLESLRLMDGLVDIYMPDLKFWDPQKAKRYLKTEKYPEAARAAIKEMHRQVGDLVIDDRRLARRGLLVRHLVMPGFLDDTRQILRFLAEEISPHTFVNIMGQYHPAGKVDARRYPEINRRPGYDELQRAHAYAREVGLRRFAD